MIADTFNETTKRFLTQPRVELTPCDYNITFDVYGYPEPRIPSIEDFKCSFRTEYPSVNIVIPYEELCKETDPNYPLGEFDSTKWAPEFKKVGVERGFLPANIDDSPGSWLHAWFCCAIMTGYDHAMQMQVTMAGEDTIEVEQDKRDPRGHIENELVDDDEYFFWSV